MLYTSGSTGRPKGVVHLHDTLPASVDGFPRRTLGLSSADRTYSTVKLCHAYGLSNNLIAPVGVAATAVLCPGRPTPQAVLARIRRFAPTVLFSIPTHYATMLEDGRDADTRDALRSLRLCVSAGERLPESVWQRWRGATGLPLLDAIGSTEMLQMYCANELGRTLPGSTGRPVPGCDLRIVDEVGADVASGEVGELLVHSPTALAHYWHDVERTRKRFVGPWFATGDRFRRNEEGWYWYEGRVDDMFKVSGLWVSPTEIERVLTDHPAVHGAAVVAQPLDDRTLIKAYVVASGEAEPGEGLACQLRDACKERLQRHQYPRTVEFVEELPRALNGKIQRFKLRERLTR